MEMPKLNSAIFVKLIHFGKMLNFAPVKCNHVRHFNRKHDCITAKMYYCNGKNFCGYKFLQILRILDKITKISTCKTFAKVTTHKSFEKKHFLK